jgi:hypothetical protein
MRHHRNARLKIFLFFGIHRAQVWNLRTVGWFAFCVLKDKKNAEISIQNDGHTYIQCNCRVIVVGRKSCKPARGRPLTLLLSLPMELGYCRAWAVAVVAAALPRLPARTKKEG